MFRQISLILIIVSVYTQCPSKYISVNGTCLSCHYTCSECLNVTKEGCLSCQLEYYRNSQQICESCPMNCRICSNWQNCSSCNVGYYLNYYLQCEKCPNGTLACTMSSIGLCLEGFYMSNIGYAHCMPCGNGLCGQCTNSSVCTICKQGYLSEGVCLSCSDPKCIYCYGSDFCQTCIDGVTADQNGKCTILCSQGCRSCISSTVCLECQPMYFLSQFTCIAGANPLCSASILPHACQQQCNSIYAYNSVTGDICIVKNTVQNDVRQIYLSALNSINSFWQATQKQCFGTHLAIKQNNMLILSNIKPCYKIVLVYQLYLLGNNNTLIIQSPFSSDSRQHTLTMKNTTQCNTTSFIGIANTTSFSLLTSFDSSKQPLQINMQSANNNIAVISIILQSYSCGVTNCLSCSTKYDCLACQQPYLIEINSCVVNCSIGLYVNPIDRSCLKQCPQTFYTLRQEYMCAKCESPCLTCQSTTVCISCINGTFLKGYNCVSDCNDVTLYGNILNKACEPCLYPCRYCSIIGSNCTSCLYGFYNPLNNTCTLTCPSGYYGQLSTLSCQICQPPCQTCMMTGTTCTRCLVPFVLYNNTCLVGCPATTVDQNSMCVKCLEPCEQCELSPDRCTKCKLGYLLNITCIDKCHNGYFGLDKRCNSCDIACQVCDGPLFSNCLQCTPSYVQYDKSCLASCPEQYYNLSGICTRCQSPCLTCLNQTACKSCLPSLSLWNMSCLLVCPDGTYSSVGICLQCQSSCEICVANACRKCLIGSYLWNDTCFSSCPSGTYNNTVDRVCQPCRLPCTTCLTNQQQCLSCYAGFNLLLDMRQCLMICPRGYYQQDTKCLKCTYPCLQCRIDKCTSCSYGYYLYDKKCQSSCPNTTYKNNNTWTCTACSLPCLNCISQLSCTSCLNSILYKYSCINVCPVGSVAQSGVCQPCLTNCSDCSWSVSNCTACQPGFYLLNASCLSVCPEGYYASSLSSRCMPCKAVCKKCLSYSVCTECIDSTYLLDSKCILQCPSHYYPYQAKCQLCHQNCTQCSISWNNCTRCRMGTFMPMSQLSTTECLAGCPALSFSFNSSCISCIQPCLTCTSAQLCLSCLASYVMFNQSCLMLCPQAWYNQSGVCQPCQPPCLICLNAFICQSCAPPYSLYSNSCVSSCPSHYYSYNHTCSVCSTICQQCLDYSTCISCHSGSALPLLQLSTCVANCSKAYYLSNQTCLKCPENCIKCQNASSCQQCASTYLYQQKCVSVCPYGYYHGYGLVCQQCKQPCQTCQNDIVCLTCIDGFLLYSTYCLTKCPISLWSDKQLKKCVSDCRQGMFRMLQTKECYRQCPDYYTDDGYCTPSCKEGQIVNSSMGCQNCSGCAVPYFKIQYLASNGTFTIMVIFSKKLTNYTQDLTFYYLQSKTYVQGEIDVTKRLLTQNDLRIMRQDAYSIWLATDSIDQNLLASSLTVRIRKQLAYMKDQYPVQNTEATTEVNYFRKYSIEQLNSGAVFYTIGQILSYITIVLLFLNLLLDNLKATLILSQTIQTLYFMSYLNIWYSPLLQNFLRGLQLSSMRYDMQYDTELMLWNSSPKNLLLSTDVNFYRNCMPTAIFLTIFIVGCCILRIIGKAFEASVWSKLNIKHELFYNHLNDAYWLFFNNLAIFALFQLHDRQDVMMTVISVVTVVGLLILSLLLGYVTISCIYDKTYREHTFFWALDITCKNTLSHMPIPLYIVKRLILVFSIGLAADTPLYFLLLILTITLLILSNVLINRPYKRYGGLLALYYVTFGTAILLTGVYSIFTLDSRQSWLLCLIIFILAVTCILLNYVIVIMEMVRVVRKKWNNSMKEEQKEQTKKEILIFEVSNEAIKKDDLKEQKHTDNLPKKSIKELSYQENRPQNTPKEESLPSVNILQPILFDSESESQEFEKPAPYLLSVDKNH